MNFASWRKKLTSITALSISAGMILAGCTTDPTTTGSISRNQEKSISQMSASELDQAEQIYAVRYEKNPKSKEIGLRYAHILRTGGSDDLAAAVMQQMVIYHPRDRQVLADYSKSLVATGNLEKALEVVRQAQRPKRPDWQLLSAEGAILDLLGKPEPARKLYAKALDLRPDEPTILSNLGMSYVLTNDLGEAETVLTKAINQPGADNSVRQNLALIIGLQGRLQEADRLARGSLPATQAEANSKNLRRMLNQKMAWKQ